MVARVDWHYWNTFLEDLDNAKDALDARNVIWFRGVTSEDHRLVPSLLRIAGAVDKERQLFERFEQLWRGLHLGAPAPSSDWDVLYEMQHYSVPTRLLDWTETLGIAVFFATLQRTNSDSFVYVLNPLKLNKLIGKNDLIGEWDRESFGYRKVFWEGQPFKPTTPIAINPLHSNPRLAAQRGRFTVHGVDQRPLEETCEGCVKRVKLRAEAKPAAKAFLRMAGIDEVEVFPDMAGAARFLTNMVGLD
jgi:hypothetical protein